MDKRPFRLESKDKSDDKAGLGLDDLKAVSVVSGLTFFGSFNWASGSVEEGEEVSTFGCAFSKTSDTIWILSLK